MRIYDIIAKKREKQALTPEEIAFAVNGFVLGKVKDYQMAALLMAIFLNGMDRKETAALTRTMVASGEVVDLSSIEGVKVDKHSTGGVGDKTTLIVAPIVAACGVKVAKMSGRGLGHSGGTIDKLESIAGMTTNLAPEQFFEIVQRVGVSIVGQSGEIVPADKKLYALRDVTATVESLPLIASSIMSKKIACGADCILLDVKTGSGAFMKSLEDSIALAEEMVAIGKSVGKRTMALVTDMERPLGFAIGNSLEVIEACETLKGRGPEDLTMVCVELAANMMCLGGMGGIEVCRERAIQAISGGNAFAKFTEMVKAQGGDVQVLNDYSAFPTAKVISVVRAQKSGYLCGMDTEKCGIAAVVLGAGRETKESAIDCAAGILLKKKTGDYVMVGEVIAELHASEEKRCERAHKIFTQAVAIADECPPEIPLIYARITGDM